MAIVRWEPFREFNELQQEMNRLFDTFNRDLTPNHRGNGNLGFVPPAEVEEDDEAIHVRLEVPGIEPNDIDIQVSAEAVAIRGERKTEEKAEENGVTRTEFRYGQFQRAFSLPTRIKNNEVKAEYKNGILMLTLPKAEEEKSKVVKVNVA